MKFSFLLYFLLFLGLSCVEKPLVKSLDGAAFEPGKGLEAYIFLHTECPICLKYQGSLHGWTRLGAPLYFVFPGDQNTEEIRAFAAYDSLAPAFVLTDPAYVLTRRLGAEITPEVLVFDQGKLRYKGLIDDRFTDLASSRAIASVNYLQNALISLQNHDSVQLHKTRAVGCFIEPH